MKNFKIYQLFLMCTSVIVFWLCGFSAQAATTYTIIDLGTLGGTASHGYGINARGQVTGSSTLAGNNNIGHAFITNSAGQMIDLGTLGGESSVGLGINIYGQVVGGSGWLGDANGHAFVTNSSGHMTDLGTLGGAQSQSLGINDNGQVTGTAQSADGNFHSFITNSAGQMITISSEGRGWYGINASGQVTGGYQVVNERGYNETHAAIFNVLGQLVADLGKLGGVTAIGLSINASGQVTGQADLYGGNLQHAFIANSGGQMTDLGVLSGYQYSIGYSINASGQVVGKVNTYPKISSVAFVTINGVMTDLNTLLADPTLANTKFLSEARAINDAGQIVANGGGHAYLLTPTSTPASAALVDPVPDLLDGTQITAKLTAADTLASTQPYLTDLSKGRAVMGLATDGVSQLVMRIPARAVGEKFTLAVRPDQCAALATNQCIDEYGLIFDPTHPPANVYGNNQNQTPIVTAVATSDGPMAFAAYRAPVDFVRSGQSNPTDQTAAQRSVSITLYSQQNGGSPDFEIKLVRPPVVFLHGLNSDASVWKSFTPLINKTNLYSINIIDYGKKLARRTFHSDGMHNITIYDVSKIGAITPAPSDSHIEFLIKTVMRQSDLGFAYNAKFVQSKVNELLDLADTSFKAGNNPAKLPVAASQVDIVAHSMGGLVARTMPLQNSYKNANNFGMGNVHKLITIGTPHLGSPLAIQILQDANKCIRESTTKIDGKESIDIGSVVLIQNGQSVRVSGGTGDLAGFGVIPISSEQPTASVSAAIKALDSSIPLALIAGDVGEHISALDGFFKPAKYIRLYCKVGMAERYSAARYSELFDAATFYPQFLTTKQAGKTLPYFSDAIVPLSSALNSDVNVDNAYSYQTNNVTMSAQQLTELERREGGKIFNNTVHGVGTLELGFPEPYLLQEQSTVPNYTESLLNTSVTDAKYHRNYRRF